MGQGFRTPWLEDPSVGSPDSGIHWGFRFVRRVGDSVGTGERTITVSLSVLQPDPPTVCVGLQGPRREVGWGAGSYPLSPTLLRRTYLWGTLESPVRSGRRDALDRSRRETAPGSRGAWEGTRAVRTGKEPRSSDTLHLGQCPTPVFGRPGADLEKPFPVRTVRDGRPTAGPPVSGPQTPDGRRRTGYLWTRSVGVGPDLFLQRVGL